MDPFQILEKNGVKEFRKPQKEVLKKGLLNKNKNFLICIPTGAGKTLIGEIAILNHILDGSKGIFTVPFKAIATEKYEEFKEKYEKFGFKIGLSIGDFDEKEDLTNFNIIITTYEKLDSLIKHESEFIEDIGVIVIDEIHMIGNDDRGGTLETLIVHLKKKNIQIVGLSATIGNPEELAEWLNAELYIDSWRPVPLFLGYFYKNKLYFENKTIDINTKCPEIDLSLDTVKNNGSVLIFCNSKRNAVSLAKKFNLESNKELKELADKILKVLPKPTQLCKDLSECIKKGVAFHHAGLTYEHRKIIEKGFKKRLIKIICCTSTLSSGINAPAKRVIIKDLKRFNKGRMEYIPIMEIKQCLGRAGRPGFEDHGEGILICKNNEDLKMIEKYIYGNPEKIYSKLSNESVLRKQILGKICLGEIKSWEDLEEFIKSTFYAHQFKNLRYLIEKIRTIMKFLEFNGFVIDFKPTKFGNLVTKLYIDPLSVVHFLEILDKNINNEIKILFAISRSTEMRNIVFTNRFEEAKYIPEMIELGLGEYLEDVSCFKLSKILYDWINCKTEDYILQKYNVDPGILKYIIDQARWILHSFIDVSKEIGKYDKKLYDLSYKLLYGIDDKFVELVKIKHIGKKRAQILFENGIKNIDDLKENKEKVIKLFGKKIAEKIFNYL